MSIEEAQISELGYALMNYSGTAKEKKRKRDEDSDEDPVTQQNEEGLADNEVSHGSHLL